MSSRLIAAVMFAALAQAGCEFQPLYGNRTATPLENDLAGVSVGIIADRTGQLLRNELSKRLDPNNQSLPARYNLSVKLNESTAQLALRRDASTTRANLTVIAQYQLVSAADGKLVSTGSVRSVNSYDILSAENEFGTRTAEEQAHMRAASDLANQISLRIGLVLDRMPDSSRRQP